MTKNEPITEEEPKDQLIPDGDVDRIDELNPGSEICMRSFTIVRKKGKDE